MTSAIQAPPNEYNFGYEFNYALWTAQTVITLSNVPWNNDYRDIVFFPGANSAARREALNAYIDASVTTNTRIEAASYAKANVPIRLDIPFNKAWEYNYLRASNPIQPISGDKQRDYYYFISDVRYIAPNTTEFVIQLDLWQTFGYDITFGNSYIERGHIGIANSKAFDSFGRDYLTIPEGIDTGGEYRTVTKRTRKIADMSLSGENFYDILVCSAADLNSNPGTVDNPLLVAAKGSSINGMPSGAAFYVYKGGDNSFYQFMSDYADYPWITQSIISITLIPKITRYYPSFTYQAKSGTNPSGSTPAPGGVGFPIRFDAFPNWRNSAEILNKIPARYRNLKKFLTFPYMMIEMTTWSGSPVILKPEAWASTDASMRERVSLVPPGQRINFHPAYYNAPDNQDGPIEPLYPSLIGVAAGYIGGDGDDQGDYLDVATGISSFPSLPIVNDGAISYLASNKNGLAFQNSSADWAQQRALRGNEASYDNTTRGMQLATELTGIGRNQDAMSTFYANDAAQAQALASAVGSVAMGGGMGALGGPAGLAVGAAGGLASGVMGAVSTGISVDAANKQLGARTAGAQAGNRAQNAATGSVRDTNKGLADWAARGDYENTIAGINAKVQDSKLTQPSVSGQFGGEAMNFINNSVELSMRWKMIDNASIALIGEYWLRYGYAVRRFGVIPASLMAMSKFTYWKLSETYIRAGGMPEPFKQAIRGIFEKGVTVWANPNDIGMIDIADNTPLGGITL